MLLPPQQENVLAKGGVRVGVRLPVFAIRGFLLCLSTFLCCFRLDLPSRCYLSFGSESFFQNTWVWMLLPPQQENVLAKGGVREGVRLPVFAIRGFLLCLSTFLCCFRLDLPSRFYLSFGSESFFQIRIPWFTDFLVSVWSSHAFARAL